MLKNERQKAKISVVKRDAETKKEIKGAVFGLYAKEDIQVGNQTLVKADTQVPNLVKSDLIFNELLTEFSVDVYS